MKSQVVLQLVRQVIYTSLLLIITLCFTCGERKICTNIKTSQSIMSMIVSKIFLLLFMSSLTVLIAKNSHILAVIYFILLQNFPKLNLKGFQYQIWTSVKRSGKYLSSKTNFNTFLQISCSNFKLKLCQRP